MVTTAKYWNLFYQLKRLYDWTLKWADHPLNTRVLAFLAVIESFFFPIPVDPLMIAMGVARPKRAFRFALITTIGSVCGAMAGYAVGALFWHLTKDFFFTYVFSQRIFDIVVAKYNQNAVISILLASFTPLPFKVFTISAGVAKLPFTAFVLSALVGRGSRFFLLSALIYRFGEPVKVFIDKYFNLLVVIFSLLGIAGYYIVPKMMGY